VTKITPFDFPIIESIKILLCNCPKTYDTYSPQQIRGVSLKPTFKEIIMKSFLRVSFAVAALALAAAASAQSVDFRLENSGRIWNKVETNAVVIDNGTSNSVAKGAQSATAVGGVSSLPIAGGQALTLYGAVETVGSGMAFNVKTGNGTGYGKSDGWSDANVNGYNTFTNEHGSITMAGKTDSGMEAPVGHGVDIHVNAGPSQDGYAAGADGGSFAIVGQTQQLPVAGGATIAAFVSDTKTSHASAEAGAVTFTDGTPAGQTAAIRTANSGNVTEASGSFIDPVVVGK
jgi:hypothetical protein